MKTFIKVKVYISETKRPAPHVPVIVSLEYTEKGSSGIASHTDTFRTGGDGQLTFNYTMSEWSNYRYSIRVLQGDSNGPSRSANALIPGYPNFYTDYVNSVLPIAVRIRHSNPSTNNAVFFGALFSEFDGGRSISLNLNLKLNQDTLMYLPAVDDHVFTGFLNCSITYNGFTNSYVYQKKFLVDYSNSQALTEFTY